MPGHPQASGRPASGWSRSPPRPESLLTRCPVGDGLKGCGGLGDVVLRSHEQFLLLVEAADECRDAFGCGVFEQPVSGERGPPQSAGHDDGVADLPDR